MSEINEEKKPMTLESMRRTLFNARRTLAVVFVAGRARAIGTIVIAVLTAVLPLVDARIFGHLINHIATGASNDSLRPWIFAVLIIGGVTPILLNVRFLLDRYNWYAIGKMFDLKVINKKAELDLASYESKEAQNIFMIYQQDGAWRVSNFVGSFPNLCWNGVAAVAALSALLYEQAWICLPIFIGTLPVLLVELWAGEAMWGIFNARGTTRRRFWHLLGCFQNASSLSEMKTYQLGTHFEKLLQALYTKFEHEEMKVEERKIVIQSAVHLLYQVIYGFVLFTLIAQVVRQEIALGTFTFLMAAVGTYRSALSGFFGELGRLREHERYVDNIWKLLELSPTLHWATCRPALDGNKLDIEICDVVAGYPESPPLFQKLNLKIAQGERVAIVGPNGAGKTTLRRLLQRDFDPQQGSITIGGYELKNFDEASLYSSLTFLSQDSNSFHFKAGEVIAFGDVRAEMNRQNVEHAAQVGGAAGFIEDPRVLPSGYDNLLGRPDGAGLSGGQWRRLAVSRAIYRLKAGQSRIMILDEPTSQVDGDGAAQLFKALKEDTSGTTILLMTHLLADIRALADRIVVLSHGQVIEDGSHDELMKREGVYYDLFKYQAKGYPAS
jgi:ABC-type multidrug transport system fused ATPase/permease subunit